MKIKTLKIVLSFLGTILILISMSCGLIAPKNNGASIIIKLKESSVQPLCKTAGSLDQMHVILTKNGSTLYDNTITASSSRFHCEITELEAGAGYAVLLYGLSNNSIIGRGYQGSISLTEGQTREVNISWGSFRPILVSPVYYILNNTPIFDWENVGSAAVYDLEVDNSISFISPEIDQNGLSSSNYTSSSPLSYDTWYWRVRAKDNQGNWGGWSDTLSFIIFPFETGTVIDREGNVYQTVKIGSQWWMAENLKVTHYRNGDAIPNITSDSEWSNLTTGAYCNFNNSNSHVNNYGRLYNWYAVNDNRNIAPIGWHVPSDDEWKQLEMYLGMSQSEAIQSGWRGTDEGGKLKEAGFSHWESPNTGATNESGFSALPGSYRTSEGNFGSSQGIVSDFWTSTEISPNLYAESRNLSNEHTEIYRLAWFKEHGFSVRCVSDI